MTSQNPDEIRNDIEATRARLSSDVDAVAEKVSPSAVVDRQKNRIKDGFSNMKDKIMGTDDTERSDVAFGSGDTQPGRAGELRDRVADDATANVRGLAQDVQRKAGEVGEQVQRTAEDAKRSIAEAPAAMQRGTRGNPLAAGLIAFGAGMLLAGLIPASRAEQEAADQLKAKAEPLVREAGEAAKQFAEDARQPLAEAGEQLRQSAADGVANVRGEGEHHAQHLAGEAKDAGRQVRDA